MKCGAPKSEDLFNHSYIDICVACHCTLEV